MTDNKPNMLKANRFTAIFLKELSEERRAEFLQFLEDEEEYEACEAIKNYWEDENKIVITDEPLPLKEEKLNHKPKSKWWQIWKR